MKPELDTYDWGEAFTYAHGEPVQFGTPCAGGTFSREDVTDIFGMDCGMNDGDSWIVYGKLRDGRYFCLRAWCDYTGWD